ncbi:transcriptional regulator, partial [Shigella sonnei]|nr:transcriptional regulator [Shigella sonnei]
HIKSHLIMLSAFVIGAYSAYWLRLIIIP